MQPEHSCPLCGGRVEELPFTILPERGMVVANGKFTVMRATEVQLLTCLAEVYPRVLSKESAMSRMYQLRPNDEPEIKIIDVLICKIRKKIEPLGLRIDTAWGKGYSLSCAAKVVEEVAA